MNATFAISKVASDAAAPPALEVAGLTKRYDNGHLALDDVSLSVRKGEIIALLGRNGAGKSTLIGSICGQITPSLGTVRVRGIDVWKNPQDARRCIGLVPQDTALDPFQTVFETMCFTQGLFGQRSARTRIEDVLSSLNLLKYAGSKVAHLSGGMKRRVMIAKSLVHRPDVLFLDEPTTGIDAMSRRETWALIRDLSRDGLTVVLTTHYLEEAEELADRVAVIDGGRLIHLEDKASLVRRLTTVLLEIQVRAPLPAAPNALSRWSPTLSSDRCKLSMSLDNKGMLTQSLIGILKDLQSSGIGDYELSLNRSSFEDVFSQVVGGEL